MNGAGPTLADRFRRTLHSFGSRERVVVAVSGGLDSCVLLHLARFAAAEGTEWIAAHFDHRMRASSADDARWVAGLCRAWDVPLRSGSAEEPPTSEASAREARYAFLERVRDESKGTLVFTAHHADDQAETVLFRLLRGTGGRGLRGIAQHRSPSIARPLLDFWRAEIEEYARAVGLTWRVDPTNRDAAFARNALRHVILPDVERLVAPGARRALVRLAETAAGDEAAWDSVLPELMRPLDVSPTEGGVTVRRTPLLELHPAVRARVVRKLARALGVELDRTATDRAVDFAESGVSGRAIDLGASLALGIELDRVAIVRSAETGSDRPLRIVDGTPGRGTAVLAGSPVPVSWGLEGVDAHEMAQDFDLAELRFPLIVRSRRPGDRIRLSAGTKKVKKVMLEHRIPPSARQRIPVVADAEGRVLWVPGLARAEGSGRAGVSGALRIGIG